MLNLEAINSRLEEIADDLDISEENRLEVENVYQAITQHLGSTNSEVNKFSPELYTQGSFRIGTVVKPYGRKGNIDIDIVCSLALAKDDTTKRDLKNLVGKELKKIKFEGLKVEPGGRCWKLTLGKNLHIDVLPAIPSETHPAPAIHLTDRDLHLWQDSNPKAFADWFGSVSNVEIELRKAEVESFPAAGAKSSLQIAVQLLKRHRDVFFKAQPDARPASILITTLAALVGSPRASLIEKLEQFSTKAIGKIEYKDGKYRLPNPVLEEENFADKWNTDPDRREAFQAWYSQLQKDLAAIRKGAALELLDELFDTSDLVNEETAEVPARTLVALGVNSIPAAGSTSHAQPPPWPALQTGHKAKIVGTIHLAKAGIKIGPVSARPISTNRHLKFWVETNLRKPFDVYWQVINTGVEAAKVKDGLRGKIEMESPAYTRWEQTSYRGTHYVVAHLVKEGRLMVSTPWLPIRIS